MVKTKTPDGLGKSFFLVDPLASAFCDIFAKKAKSDECRFFVPKLSTNTTKYFINKR